MSHLGFEDDMGAGCTAEDPGAKIPDMTPAERAAYARGHTAAREELKEILEALGWSTGSAHLVAQEIRALREHEASLRGALLAALKAAQGFRDRLGKLDDPALNVPRRHMATAVAVGVRYLDSRRGLIPPALVAALPTSILAMWQDGQDRARCSPVPTSTPSTPSTSPVP